jgi:hypothetical protein
MQTSILAELSETRRFEAYKHHLTSKFVCFGAALLVLSITIGTTFVMLVLFKQDNHFHSGKDL